MSPLPLLRPHRHCPHQLPGHNLTTETDLAVVDTRFHYSYRSAVYNIAKGLYNSRSVTTNRHWAKWAAFCREVALDPLFVLYRDLPPSSTTLQGDTVHNPLPPADFKYYPAQLSMMCGRFMRRSLIWKPDTPASQAKGNWTSHSASSHVDTPGITHQQSK